MVKLYAPNIYKRILMFVVVQGKYEIVKLLLKHGADAAKKNRDGHTPLDLVKEGDQVVLNIYLSNSIYLYNYIYLSI